MTEIEVEGIKPEKYMSPILMSMLDKVKKRVMHKDMDWVCVIDGREGSGKSTLAQQIAMYLDPTFNIDRIYFSVDDMIKKSMELGKGKAQILDEAFLDINSKESMTEMSRKITAYSTEMRQLNQFTIICIPTFFDLQRHFAVWRSSSLIHVYFDEDYNRGNAIIFPINEKKNLFILGKKFYDYDCVKSPYTPVRFTGWYAVDEAEYRKRKMQNLHERLKDEEKSLSPRAALTAAQRNVLLQFAAKTIGRFYREKINEMMVNAGLPKISPIVISQWAHDE